MSEQLIDVEHREHDSLIRALRERTAQLDAANKEFDQFTHSVSHDLRAPLRALEGFAQILVEDYGSNLDPEAKRCLEIIAASSRKASLLIEDLLVLSRLGRQELKPARVNMLELAKNTVLDLRPGSDRIEFRFDEMPEAWGDKAQLGQVFHHLVDNAMKFTRRQEHPIVEIGGRAEPEHTAYYVRDNGVGFDMKYVGRLFGIFQRLHSDQEFEGRGIGLAIVQRLIHRHGGEVWAEGTVQQGATFFFSLPLEKSQEVGSSLDFPVG